VTCKNQEYCWQFAVSHTLPEECCASIPGCRDAIYLLSIFEHVKGLVVVDCVVAVVGCLLAFYATSIPEDCRGKREKCYVFLVLIAMLDGILSSVVHVTLNSDSPGSQMDTLELMDQLYSSECFTRQQDKVIFETLQTLKQYAETVVAVQIALAFMDAGYHFVSVVHFKGTITPARYVKASALFGASELIAAAVGVSAYIDVTSQFSEMYSQMNSAGGTSQACVSSCCLPAVASSSAGTGGGMSGGAIAGIATAVSVAFLGGVWCCIRSEMAHGPASAGGAPDQVAVELTRKNPMGFTI
jgi:hypothetical protein